MKFNSVIPELSVSDLAKSLRFYLDVLGFKKEYDRPDDKFSFISIENAQLMLEEVNGHWQTGPLEQPFGRGINLQIRVSDLTPMLRNLEQENYSLFKNPSDQWYNVGERRERQREFLVMDPDGYLLRFCQALGSKP